MTKCTYHNWCWVPLGSTIFESFKNQKSKLFFGFINLDLSLRIFVTFYCRLWRSLAFILPKSQRCEKTSNWCKIAIISLSNSFEHLNDFEIMSTTCEFTSARHLCTSQILNWNKPNLDAFQYLTVVFSYSVEKCCLWPMDPKWVGPMGWYYVIRNTTWPPRVSA